MKIAHIIPSLQKNLGGPPRVCVGLCKALQQLGHRTFILTEDARGWAPTELAGITVVSARSAVHRVKLTLEVARACDIVHFHSVWDPWSNLVAGILKMAAVPYVFMPHGCLNPWAYGQKVWKKALFLNLLTRPILNNSAFLHVCNSAEAESVRQRRVRARCAVIPNGFAPAPQGSPPTPTIDPSAAGTRLSITHLGRLHKKKGVDILLQGFDRIAAEFPNCDLIVAGPDDGEAAALRELAAQLPHGNRVKFVGMVDGTSRAELLDTTDVFALISHEEGHPMAVVEAAALGKALLITPGCNCPDLVNGLHALVVRPDPAEVAQGLQRLLSSRKLRESLGRAAREVAAGVYDWALIAERLSIEYETVKSRNISAN